MSTRPSILIAALSACSSVALVTAQNDECDFAIDVNLGVAEPFSTVGATTSFNWPCAAGGCDIWFQFTAPASGGVTVSTCGSSYDTAIEAFSGTCGALVSLDCNDDQCGLQSSFSFPASAGATYLLRVGGYASLTGAGTITVDLTPPLSNDECSTAVPVLHGVPTLFDTTGSTTSQPWTCAAGGKDVWFSYVALTSGVPLRMETCGSLFNTALEVFEGSCGSLHSLACVDDHCGQHSLIQIPNIVAGTMYIMRIGGFFSQTGLGTLVVLEGQPPLQGCVLNPGFETGDLAGWSVNDHPTPFFPVRVVGAGQSPGLGLFSSAPTEGQFAVVHGFDGGGPGVIGLAQDFVVDPGLTPLTFDYRAGWDMASFPGSTLDRTFDVVVRDPLTGAGLQSTPILTARATTSTVDTGPMTGAVDLSPFLGQAVRVSFEWTIPEAFTGPGFFQLDNVTCPFGSGGLGANYCPANPNSTGVAGHLLATGSVVVAANALTLVAERLPLNAFGYFLSSSTQTVVPNPSGSAGVLCLGGQIGRYVGPGQVQHSGLTGTISLLLDLTQTPTPTGFVSVLVGESRNFQAWHRDAAAGGGTTSNFTDGLRMTFH